MPVRDRVEVDILTETRQSQTNLKQLVAGFFTAQAAWSAAQQVLQKTVQFMRESVEAAKAQQDAEMKLAGVLKATGEAAGFNAEELKNMASGLQQVTTYGDEAILSAQSILLTFKGLQGEAFERTQELALDLSAAFGQDLKSSAIQLGKALEDPKRGLTSLRRIGVSFTEAQEEQIDSMVEAGDVAEAQAMILDTLESQVGGVAREMANSSGGAIKQMKNAVGDLKEEIGFLIMEGFEPLARSIKKNAEINASYLRSVREMEAALTKVKDAGAAASYEELNSALEATNQQMEQFAQRSQTLSAGDVLQGLLGFGSQGQLQRLAELQKAAEERARLTERVAAAEKQATRWQAVQAEYNKAAAEKARAEAEAKEKQAEIDMEYMEVRSRVLGILESEKTELEKLQQQYDYLAEHPWAGGELEEERLEAMQILLDRMEEIRKEMELAEAEQAELTVAGKKWREDVGYTKDDFNEISDTLDDISGGMSSFVNPIFAMFQNINNEIKNFNDAVDYMKDGLAAAAGEGYLEAFEQLGEAFQQGQSGAEAMTGALQDFVGAIINAMPKLLFYAGVQLLTPATWPIGLGLIIMSGVAAIAKGAYNSEHGNDNGEAADSTEENTTVIYIEGSVVSEAELEQVVTNAQSRNYGSY